MKSVLISIQPKWCELIASGKKTVEVRKTKPKLETPFKVYIYCTNNKDMLWILKESERESRRKITSIFTAKDVGGATKANGKVIGEFVCKAILPISITYSDPNSSIALREFPFTCLTDKEIMDYLGNGNTGYGWCISDLAIYDKPRELSEFYVPIKDHWETYDPNKYINGRWQKPLTRPPQSWCYVESEVDTE